VRPAVDARTASNIGRFLAALDAATAETGISIGPNGAATIEDRDGNILGDLDRHVEPPRYCTYRFRGESL
jgi:hypothetical protein